MTAAVPFRSTLASEWIKLATLRSTWLGQLVGLLVGVGLTALTAAAVGATWREWPEAELAAFDPVLYPMLGTIAPAITLVVLAVRTMTQEHGSGMVRLTMTVTPRRSRVLAAKALLVAAVALVVSAVATAATFAVGQAIFAASGLPTAGATEPDAARALVLATVLGPVFPLLALALAVLWRRTAVAVTATIALVIAPTFVGPALPASWQRNILGFLPGRAGDALAIGHLEDAALYQPPAVSALVVVAWLVAAGAAAFTQLSRRDL
jgi:ABC-2 type transport system permease protein